MQCHVVRGHMRKPGTLVRVLFFDYAKTFDLINHEILINTLAAMTLPT